MKIFKFRVIIDTEEDVFRDIEIPADASLFEFHKAILKAFNWEEGEMASFYLSNEMWEKGTEISLMDMMEPGFSDGLMTMSGTKLSSVVKGEDTKLIYVYDFLRMWCFYIELVGQQEAIPEKNYPLVSMSYGDAPAMDSKEVDLFDDDLFLADDKGKDNPELTGDPEIDAYLMEDNSDDLDDSNFESLDGLDEFI